jgi:DNA repair protein RecO (recombination protein O)
VPRESSFTALVIKKQPLGEADEIVTLFSRGEGKVRAVAKSSKLATSKLQYALQPLFLIDATIAGKANLPKLIRANVIKSYAILRDFPQRVATWFVVAELLIRLLPDGAPNETLYDSVLLFLAFMNGPAEITDAELELALLKFKLDAMAATGLAIHDIAKLDRAKTLLFSPSKGGFYYDAAGRKGSADATAINAAVWKGFQDLKTAEFNNLPPVASWQNELSKLISSFISYQLEREIKSEKYLKPVS